MSKHPSELSVWNKEVLDRLQFASQGTRWAVQSPTGTGKTRVIARAVRAWRAVAPTRTLIVSSRIMAANFAEQISEQAQMRWLSKAFLRDKADVAFGAPEDLLAATAPEALGDPWAADLLSGVRWDSIVVDLDAVRSDAIEPLALLASRHPTAYLVAFSSTPGSEEVANRLGLTLLRYGGTLADAYYRPESRFDERFHAAVFERSGHEQSVLTAVDLAVGEAGPLAQRLGLLEVQAAASSSFYALQESALAALERLRETRNVLVHHGLAADDRFREERAIENATLVQVFARLERIAAQVDELDHDSRQDALLQLIMKPALVDHSGSTVVLSSSGATAEYIDHGLRLMGLSSTTLPDLRDHETPLRARLDTAGAIIILTDPELTGLELTGARQVINYDLPGTPERLAVRSTRIRWIDSPWDFWTLLPTQGQLSDRERVAVGWAPYLVAHPLYFGQ